MADRLHILDIRFENGRTATITLRDKGSDGVQFAVAGLLHIAKTSCESYTIREAQ